MLEKKDGGVFMMKGKRKRHTSPYATNKPTS